jgi:formamidopyrimidine-DNA glycosylase
LSLLRWQRLHQAVREVLLQAVRDGGTTLQDFRDADGQYGGFQHRLQVYDRVGEPCTRCGRGIRRIVQAGRGTFYCPGCQH